MSGPGISGGLSYYADGTYRNSEEYRTACRQTLYFRLVM